MLAIRLQRMGRTKKPSYRLIVSEKARDTQYGNLEVLGIYNPTRNPKQIELNAERIQYWIGKGAQPSATVKNLLITAGIVKGEKARSVHISKKRAKKIEAKKPAPASGVTSVEAPQA